MKFIAKSISKVVSQETRIPYQYIATFTGSIVVVSTGMLFGWATPSLPQLLSPDSPIPLSDSDGSWLAVMPCIGAVVGCLAAARIVDKIGRKTTMLLVSPIYFVSWMMIAYSQSIAVYNWARLLSGISDGIALTAFPMYLGEISDSKIRGLLASSIPVNTVVGFMVVSMIGSCLSIKLTALVSSTLPILHFVLFSFMPESPYFLLMKGKPKESKEMLIKLRGYTDVDEELKRLEKAVEEENNLETNIWDLFTVRSNRAAVYIVVCLRGLQQLCGPMAIMFYTTIIFNESGNSLSAATSTNIYFALQVICAIICSFLVDKVGRRPLLALSALGSCLALAVEGSYFYVRDYTSIDVTNFSWIPIAALLSYNIIFNLGIGTIPVMMLSELFPTNVKAFALCLADIYFGVVVIFVSKFFQIMKDSFGMHVPFLAFSFFSAIGLIYIIFCIPETKGKTLEEIQDYFKGRVNKKDIQTHL
ncbi:PREDICTED: facilitated trehalose transporter Tret1-like [Nicrophorus vespilloides]|uniref:Facilitated trehalose transporter Tret1-like n=1 Tax=Nicrophorus vespilloides TaxID=110193 RepID=A0ABM1M961_NICVS|nr:PREDICTED: facilitated trehalose transporter Tret1-like [Nicrophorus vespilloides]